MPEVIEQSTSHAIIMADSRAAAIAHAEKIAGKVFPDISYNQLRVMRGFNTSLETRSVLANLRDEKLRSEQAAESKQQFVARVERFVARGSLVDEVIRYGEGQYGLTQDGGV